MESTKTFIGNSFAFLLPIMVDEDKNKYETFTFERWQSHKKKETDVGVWEMENGRKILVTPKAQGHD